MVLLQQREELRRASCATTAPCARVSADGLREQLIPGRTQHAIARHRADQQLVQLLDQPVALVLVDDEREVQIVRGLAHQIDLLLGEQLERVAELVQDGADVAADEAHGRARPDHLHAAQLARDPRPAHRAAAGRACSPADRATR